MNIIFSEFIYNKRIHLFIEKKQKQVKTRNDVPCLLVFGTILSDLQADYNL